MKIAVLGYAHPFGEGTYYGAEREIWYLIQEFKKKGHECVVFSVKGTNVPGFEYVQIHTPWEGEVDIYMEAIREYEKDHTPFDYIHSYQASGHISEPIRKRAYSLEPFFSFHNFKENIISYSHKLNSVNGGTSTVIHFGIPKEQFSPPEELKDYAIWIGRIDMGKAPDIAIEVAKRAGIRLVLMGPSYHYPYFVDNIWPHIDDYKVIWLRSIDDEMKFKVIKGAKVFLNTNWCQYHEMFGITNIEALACGVPIIGWGHTTEPSAINFEGGEIITHGTHGFINEYNDYSDEEREKSIQNGVDFVKRIGEIDRNKCYELFLEKFTSELMADRHLKYFDIIKKRGKVLNITGEIM